MKKKYKKAMTTLRPSFVTLDDLEAWLACRLRWKLTHERPPDAELPPWEHLQRCVLDSVFFYHHERARPGQVHYASVQEHFWDGFERQSLAVSQSYPPGERARDMRAGENLLEKYVAESPPDAPALLGTRVTVSARFPGIKLPLSVRADLLHSGPTPVLLRVVRATPDPALAQFHLAPWAAAMSFALGTQFGRHPRQLEAVFLVASESPQVVRLRLPVPPPETLDKLRSWLNAYTISLAKGEVFPQPGERCADCAFRESCAHWPGQSAE